MTAERIKDDFSSSGTDKKQPDKIKQTSPITHEALLDTKQPELTEKTVNIDLAAVDKPSSEEKK